MPTFASVSFASSTPWPVLLFVIAVVSGLCLWALFRRGSIADRARSDDAQSSGGD